MNRFSPAEMEMYLGQMVRSKKKWLEDFSTGKNKWPNDIIAQKRRDMEVLMQARASYQALREQKEKRDAA